MEKLTIIGIILCALGNLLFIRSSKMKLAKALLESRTDVLTGIGNRRSWTEQIESLQTNHVSFSFVLFDAANFKAANTELGHDKADDLLRRIAQAVRSGDFVGCRLGGDEFGVAMPGATLAEAQAVCDRIQYTVGVELLPSGSPVFLSGAPGSWEPGQDMRQKLNSADFSLERRKARRKAQLSLTA